MMCLTKPVGTAAIHFRIVVFTHFYSSQSLLVAFVCCSVADKINCVDKRVVLLMEGNFLRKLPSELMQGQKTEFNRMLKHSFAQ